MKLYGKINFFFLVCFIFLTGSIQAQYYLTGQDPASVRWKQIKTGDIQLVFPKGYDKIAQYYMNILELTNFNVREPYLTKQARLTVVLHNASTTSNAMVSPTPFHADFFEMPGQQSYPQIWQKQLALHEYRHAAQMNKMRQGFGKVLYYLLGQQGTAAVFGIFLPFWFIEGDAVYSETIHSSSGRGRVPDFVYPLQAQVQKQGIYPYDKALFGSYRNFVPDHYSLGYQLVLKGIEQHGIGMWNNVLNRVARKSYSFRPFTRGIKKNTGHGKVKFYQNTLHDLQSTWEQSMSEQQVDPIKIIPTKEKFYTNYLFPQTLASGKIIAEKSGIDDINRFVLLDEQGKETQLFTPGYDFKASLSANDSLICWNEQQFDPRWGNRDYSDIKLYNFKTKQLRQITRKSRYFAPSLSPDAHQIVAAKVDMTQHYFLNFLSSRDGHLIKSFKTPDNLFFMQPGWSADGKQLVVSVLGDKGKSLLLLNTNDYSYRLLLPFSYSEISHPAIFGKWVIYTGTYEGKDNLYAINLETAQVSRLLNARYGAKGANFSSDGTKVYFSNYTANGFKPAYISFDPSHLKPFDIHKPAYSYPIDKLITPKTFNLDDTTISQKQYPIEKYSRLGHLFHPHSWAPLNIDPNAIYFSPGISLMSQNNLSTAVSTLGYTYDLNERTSKVNFNFDYYGWYPVISVGVDYGNRRTFSYNNSGTRLPLNWHETNLYMNVKVPLSFSHGKWLRGIQPSIGYTGKFLQTYDHSAFNFSENSISAFTYQLYLYNQHKRSAKDLYPKWGQHLYLVYRHTPFSDSPSHQFALQSWFNLPGIIRHQGLRIYYGYQWRDDGNYQFSGIVPVPRGYQNLYYNRTQTLKVDYAFPIAYPDMDWQGAAYLTRLYAHVFYDYMKAENGNNFRSTGIALYSNWHFLSFFPEVTMGVRWSITRESNQTYEFLYTIQF